MEILEKVEQLKAELDSLQPLNAEFEARVMQKLRLDWNYHSNKLEGNTYSYGETKMLLMKGLTAGGKPVRDHEEITGHDQAITFIIDSIKADEPLTEVFIRHLHKLTLVKQFCADAKTADGQPTKRLIKVGEYKTEPNHVETLSGEIFRFAEPIETPAEMNELVEWFREKLSRQEVSAVLLAAEFHYRFVRIHPFDDGNGRLARLLMNFVLMKYGFPPVIIKNEDKENYIAVLEQADFKILDPFIEFIGKALSESIELMIRGGRGHKIDDPDDLDKEISLLERRIRGRGFFVEKPKGAGAIKEVFENSIAPLIIRFLETCMKFDRFYIATEVIVYVDGDSVTIENSQDFIQAIGRSIGMRGANLAKLTLRYLYDSFNQSTVKEFGYTTDLQINFETTRYKILETVDTPRFPSGKLAGSSPTKESQMLEKLYSEVLTDEEIDGLVSAKFYNHRQFLETKLESDHE